MTNKTKLRELALKATPGPLHWYTDWRDDLNWKSNQEFLQACEPQFVVALLDELETKERECIEKDAEIKRLQVQNSNLRNRVDELMNR